MDVLRDTRVCCSRDYPQQGSRCLSRLLVSRHPDVWAAYGQVRTHTCVHQNQTGEIVCYIVCLLCLQSSLLRPRSNENLQYHSERHRHDWVPKEDHQERRQPHQETLQVGGAVPQTDSPHLLVQTTETCVCVDRDNPSERLGNLKNGVKDIQKHKWVGSTTSTNIWLSSGTPHKLNFLLVCSGGLRVLIGRAWRKELWLHPSYLMWVEADFILFIKNLCFIW